MFWHFTMEIKCLRISCHSSMRNPKIQSKSFISNLIEQISGDTVTYEESDDTVTIPEGLFDPDKMRDLTLNRQLAVALMSTEKIVKFNKNSIWIILNSYTCAKHQNYYRPLYLLHRS